MRWEIVVFFLIGRYSVNKAFLLTGAELHRKDSYDRTMESFGLQPKILQSLGQKKMTVGIARWIVNLFYVNSFTPPKTIPSHSLPDRLQFR